MTNFLNLQKIVHSLLMFCFPIFVFADVVIPMQNRGGVYYIPCKVNGHSEEFIFDTGASNVCLSKNFLNRLISSGAISSADKIGTGSSQVADGRSIKHDLYNIRSLTIGTRTINNVHAVVIDGQNAPLLLGQTAIRRLGKIQFDNNYLIIKEAASSKKGSDSSSIISSALEHYYKGNFRNAAESLIPEWQNGSLSNAQKLILMDSYNNATDVQGIGNREDALEILHDIELDDEILNTFGEDKYYLISGTAYSGASRNISAQESFRKAFECTSDNLTKARSLINLANSFAVEDMSRNADKCNNIYWDSLDWLAMVFENETGTWLDYKDFMSACLTPSYKIFSYMGDELRQLAEEATFSILISGFIGGQYSSEEYGDMMNALIESGNKYAQKFKRGY